MSNRKIRQGVVVSDKMDQTVIVLEEQSFLHPVYKKRVKRRKKYVAHNPENEAKMGFVVKIEETRPISKTKRWRILEIIERGA
jgi:small subunit ribosomal protein S17